MTVANPHRRKPRTCEVCSTTYIPTYSKQRTCGRTCGVVLKGHTPGRETTLSRRDLNAPITREQRWLETHRAQVKRDYMLARYHADPHNWSTANKRRRLFERDAWRCRICRKQVTDTVHKTHDKRAVAGHILAAATGGQWTDDNMATLCYPCNRADGVNKIPIQTALSFSTNTVFSVEPS